MGDLLASFRKTVLTGLLLAIILLIGFANTQQGGSVYNPLFQVSLFKWLHVFFGILWIGLLYYFNFVQIRTMPKIPAELKPAVSKYIAPEALFWFRWAALLTVVTGLIVAYMNGYVHRALTLGALDGFANLRDTFIGMGMWLAIIMFLNVWLVIWPNQKIALGMVEADADAKANAAKTAMMFSRVNMMLSFPMLASMAKTQTWFGS